MLRPYGRRRQRWLCARRVALYGVNKLIAFKKRDKDSVPYRNDFTSPALSVS